MTTTREILDRTMAPHHYDKVGRRLVSDARCCGCWNLVSDFAGIRFECNECGDTRDPYDVLGPEESP